MLTPYEHQHEEHQDSHQSPLQSQEVEREQQQHQTQTQTQQTLYFAYGSNLSTTQMTSRCPGARIHTPAPIGYLPNYKWHISSRGYASVVPAVVTQEAPPPTTTTTVPAPSTTSESEGRSAEGAGGEGERGDQKRRKAKEKEKERGVYGTLYTLPASGEELLDMYEGVPHAYEKHYLDVHFYTATQPQQQGEERTDDKLLSRVGTAKALVYIDPRHETGVCRAEYRERMKRGFAEAGELGFPRSYAELLAGEWLEVGNREGHGQENEYGRRRMVIEKVDRWNG